MRALTQSFVWRPSLLAAVSRRELVLWCLVVAGAAHLFDGLALNPGRDALGQLNGFVFLAWACAFYIAWRDPDCAAARPAEIAGAAALCALILPAHGGALMIPVTALGGWLVVRRGHSSDMRRVGVIVLAIAAQRLWSRVIMTLFTGPILRADTALAGWLMRIVTPGATWSGNRITPPDGPGVTVYMGCSSFANLSLMFLCFAALGTVAGARDARRIAITLLASAGLLIALNTARLMLMARSLELYHYWHWGTGKAIYGVVATLVTVLCCNLGARWAAYERRS